jgi:hypothetical protein
VPLQAPDYGPPSMPMRGGALADLEKRRGLVGSGNQPRPLTQPIRWGAITLRNSLELMILVFFQNLGKCRWFPVTR